MKLAFTQLCDQNFTIAKLVVYSLSWKAVDACSIVPKGTFNKKRIFQKEK